MDIQSSVLSQLFALYPVIIQGWVSPLKPADLAHGGIPKSLYDGQPQGLECLVDPWGELQLLSWTMAVDDRIDLYVNDDPTPVSGKTVAPGEEQQRIRLYVPHGRLRNGVNRLHYKVIRPGGNSEDSRDLNVLYYLRSPGEPAPNGLDLVIPPDVIKDGVSAVRAAQGVEFGFTYSNRRAYDRIRFQLGDESVEWEIADVSTPVTKTLFTDTFQQVGDNPNLLLDFVVFDQLGNFSRSSTKEVDVHLGRVNLSAAILREIPTENNDDPSTVDLAKLNGNSLSALIHLVETIWKVGDSIKLVFTAELNGSVVATHEETPTVTQVPSHFLWSVPNNKIIANSTVKVVYQLVRGGTVIATSIPATAQVIGEGAIKLDPATLVAPAVSPIDLFLYLNGVTVRTEFLAALAGDKARLIEINPAPGGTPFPEVAFNANKRTNTVLNRKFLAARHGARLEFRWALIRGGKEIARSGPLVLNVKRIVDGDTRFPTPVVAGQTGRELDVTKLVASDKLSIAQWIGQVSGQPVWLRYDGFKADGNVTSHTVFEGSAHQSAEGLVTPAAVEWLKGLKDGSEMKVTFKVNFDGVANAGTAVTFPVRTYSVKALVELRLEITSVKDTKGVEIPKGSTTGDTSVTLTGQASKGQRVEIFNGSTSKGEAMADATTGIWTKKVSGLVFGARSFTAKGLYGNNPTSPVRTLIVVGIIARIPVGPDLSDMVLSPDGSRAFACHTSLQGTVSVINTVKQKVEKIITIGTGAMGYPNAIAISRDGTRMVVCHYSAHKVSFIDPVRQTLINTLRATDSGPGDVALSPDGTRAFVASGDGGSYGAPVVAILNTLSQTLIGTVPLGGRGQALSIALTPDGARAFVSVAALDARGYLEVLDTVTQRVIKTLPVYSHWGKIAFSPDGTRAFACNNSAQGLTVIDAVSLTVTGTIPVEIVGTGGLHHLVISPDGTRALVTYDEKISIINLTSLTVETTLSVGGRPYAIAISPDGTRAFVSNFDPNTVMVMVIG